MLFKASGQISQVITLVAPFSKSHAESVRVAASWNFITMQSDNYSAVMMEFTTPPSYGSQRVTLGGIAEDGRILCAGAQEHVVHTSSKQDHEVGWPEPEAAEFHWAGRSSDGVPVSADFSGSLGGRVDRVDVLAQIPKFLKVIIAQAAGSKPFIYQYIPTTPFTVKVGDEEHTVNGRGFSEVTFITG